MFSGVYVKPARQARLVDGKLLLCDVKGETLKAIRCGNIDQRCHEDCAWFTVAKDAEHFYCAGMPIALVWKDKNDDEMATRQKEYEKRVAEIAAEIREERKEDYKAKAKTPAKTSTKKAKEKA